MDPVQSAKDEMGGIESFFAKLPGIKGYREKEIRRDADKQVRDNLARRLESRRRKLTALQGDLLSSGGCCGWTTSSASSAACSCSSTASRPRPTATRRCGASTGERR